MNEEKMYKGKVMASYYEMETGYLEKKPKSFVGMYSYLINDRIVDPDSIGESTGLYDAVGNLVFEGDILVSIIDHSQIGMVVIDDKGNFMLRRCRCEADEERDIPLTEKLVSAYTYSTTLFMLKAYSDVIASEKYLPSVITRPEN